MDFAFFGNPVVLKLPRVAGVLDRRHLQARLFADLLQTCRCKEIEVSRYVEPAPRRSPASKSFAGIVRRFDEERAALAQQRYRVANGRHDVATMFEHVHHRHRVESLGGEFRRQRLA